MLFAFIHIIVPLGGRSCVAIIVFNYLYFNIRFRMKMLGGAFFVGLGDVQIIAQ